MKRYITPILLACICLGTPTGCQTPEAVTRQPRLRLPAQPVLILPVLPAGAVEGAGIEEMTQALRRELTGSLGTRAVFAADLRRLETTLAPGNLYRDGQLALSEIATLSQVVDCGAAFVFALGDSSPYAPQRLTGTAILVDTKSAAIVAERLVAIDLGHRETLAAYCHYLKHVQAFRVGNLESMEEDRLHTALLSPALFRRFVAYAIVRDLFSGQAAGTPLSMQRTTRREPFWQHRRKED